jgi:hypothetical protein
MKAIDDLPPNAAVDHLAIRELVEPTHTADRSDAKEQDGSFHRRQDFVTGFWYRPPTPVFMQATR